MRTKKVLITTAVAAVVTMGSSAIYKLYKNKKKDIVIDPTKVNFPEVNSNTPLDHRISELVLHYQKDAIAMLQDLIAIPDPLLRLNFLKERILEIGAVESMSDIFSDESTLEWTVSDQNCLNPKVFYYDGTVFTPNITVAEGNVLSGCGAADQLQGIVAQVFATKIILESQAHGSLVGTKIKSRVSVDDDYDRPFMHSQLVQNEVPDCVIFTKPTNCAINIAQRGRDLAKFTIQGPNALEDGARAVCNTRIKSFHHDFLGDSTCDVVQVASSGQQFTYVVDHRLTIGDTTKVGGEPIESYPPFWTPPDHSAIKTAVECFDRMVAPYCNDTHTVGKWDGITAGAGYCVRLDHTKYSVEHKRWVRDGDMIHPPMFGIGAGKEEDAGTTHECISPDDIWKPIAVIARFPSLYASIS